MKSKRLDGTLLLVAVAVAGISLMPSAGVAASCDGPNVSAYGAIPNDGIDDTAAIQNAINTESSASPTSLLCFSSGIYNISAKITIPQGKILALYGDGYRNTTFAIAPNITAFEYIRVVGQGSSLLEIRGIRFVESGLHKTSVAINWQGATPATSDVWLRVEDSGFSGLSQGVHLKWATQCHFVGNVAQNNNWVYYIDRGSAFIYFERCINVGNNSFIYADDPMADALSNAIYVNECSSINGSDIDLRVSGFQALFVNNSSFTQGVGGTAAVYMAAVRDFYFRSTSVSSNLSAAPNRYGFWIDGEVHTGAISNSTIANNLAGVEITGIPGRMSHKLTIQGNRFRGNTANDVFMSNAQAVKITDNSTTSTPSRTGTNFEVYGTGTDYCVAKMNTFRQSSYAIGLGAHSVVGDNLFSVPE